MGVSGEQFGEAVKSPPNPNTYKYNTVQVIVDKGTWNCANIDGLFSNTLRFEKKAYRRIDVNGIPHTLFFWSYNGLIVNTNYF